jgi:sulfur-oxidizing protein SoxY|tara:strand:- start:1522 stop:1983 length:462 start_codon:yes stop_codon:yes gene_type:complete
MKRRKLINNLFKTTIGAFLISPSLLLPKIIKAAINQPAFAAKEYTQTLKELFGTEQVQDSSEVKMKVPEIAENGAMVPVTVISSLSGIESISIIIEKNIRPLSAHYHLGKGMKPFIITRVKMRQSSNVHAVVKIGDQLFKATSKVTVTVGGCN